jgi:hypothetical protein
MDFEAQLDMTETDNWFDGQLRDITYETDGRRTEVVLELDLPVCAGAAERHVRAYRFIEVQEIVVAATSAELKRLKVIKGHITQGRLNESELLDLSVYTTGGYIRIVAVQVERCVVTSGGADPG